VPNETRAPSAAGHELPKFREAVSRFPLEPLEDFDMTDGIAPTFDLLDRAYSEALQRRTTCCWRGSRRATVDHEVRTLEVSQKMDRYESKHFSGRRNGASFKQYKSYRLLLFRKR